MAFEREAAKQAASNKEDDDPGLDLALRSASDHQLALRREDNRHKELMSRQN